MPDPTCRSCGQPLDPSTGRKAPSNAALGPGFRTVIVQCQRCKTDSMVRVPTGRRPEGEVEGE